MRSLAWRLSCLQKVNVNSGKPKNRQARWSLPALKREILAGWLARPGVEQAHPSKLRARLAHMLPAMYALRKYRANPAAMPKAVTEGKVLPSVDQQDARMRRVVDAACDVLDHFVWGHHGCNQDIWLTTLQGLGKPLLKKQRSWVLALVRALLEMLLQHMQPKVKRASGQPCQPTPQDHQDVCNLLNYLHPVYFPHTPGVAPRQRSRRGGAWAAKFLKGTQRKLKVACLELYSGHGLWADIGHEIFGVPSDAACSYDWDPALRPSRVVDLSTDEGLQVLEAHLQALAAAGRFIVVWISWPCEAHSQANKSSRDREAQVDTARCNFNRLMPIVVKYAGLMVGENPALSSIWADMDWERICKNRLTSHDLTHLVNYCRYGSLLFKPTLLVFSVHRLHREFLPYAFRCTNDPHDKGQQPCPMVQFGHTHGKWDRTSYAQRIKVPDHLLVMVWGAIERTLQMIRQVILDLEFQA